MRGSQTVDGVTPMTPETITRETAISYCEHGTSVYTGRLENGRLKVSVQVHVVVTKSGKYLRTDKNSIEADNLGELPEF